MEETDPRLVKQCQDELVALVLAWADRGIAPSHGSMILAGVAHTFLSKTQYTFGEMVMLMAQAWKENDGKL